MGDLSKTIENRFASSVRNRARLWCVSKRARGSPRQSLQAELSIGQEIIFHTHGTIACTGVLQSRRDDHDDDETTQQNLIEDRCIYEAMTKYGDLSIDEILGSNNFIIRALGMLDARLGTTRLSKMNMKHEPLVVRRLFYFRCQNEGLYVEQSTHAITARKGPKYSRWGNEPDPETQSKETLSTHKRKQDIRAVLTDLKRGLTPDTFDNPLARLVMECLRTKESRELCIDCLITLSSCSKLVNETYLRGVYELLRERHAWLRPIESWKPRSHNADRQFRSLARHLFANYEVPAFMDQAWLSGNRQYQAWFRQIGEGHNIRKAANLPVPLTKMMAHHFMSCPEHYSIESAFRWGQARALGADRQMADAIVQSRLSETFQDNDFWLSVIAFFARNPMLDTAQIGPIVDYIWNQKYDNVMEFVERGVAVNRGPAQPNFSMKGRTANSLLEQVERWHHRLGKSKAGANLSWPKSAVRDFEFIEGSAESKNMRIWKIYELLSARELIDEGRQMKHCVATYAQSCWQGVCGIWSMSLQTKDGVAKAVTIEVRLGQRKQIRQVRGKMNRMPTAKEREVIQRWAAQTGISFSP